MDLDPPLTLGRQPSEVARARRYVAQACAGMPSDLASIAQLLTSEVVTNAISHGTGQIELRVAEQSRQLRVEVTDESAVAPRRGRGAPEDLNGRGLMIVERLSSAWGITPASNGSGKTVWFTLRTR